MDEINDEQAQIQDLENLEEHVENDGEDKSETIAFETENVHEGYENDESDHSENNQDFDDSLESN